MKFLLGVGITLFFYFSVEAQKIIDPCFASLTQVGFYDGSDQIQNVCSCSDRTRSSDLLEWNGDAWMGTAAYSDVDLPPPPGCNNRAIWLGYENWTVNGEGVAFKLDKPLELGKTYTYTFTYASDGKGANEKFSPMVYTHNDPLFPQSIFLSTATVGRLPEVDNWTTNTITFTAARIHDGDSWLILRAKESSGMILSNCDMKELDENFLREDQLICIGDATTITAPTSEFYKYEWSTGDNSNSIIVDQQGVYSLAISYSNCVVEDEVFIETRDCVPLMVMPNYFSPNGDDYNEQFVPKETNYITTGSITIYNRWGLKIFTGDLFEGWDGRQNNKEVSSGVYYYTIFYMDEDNFRYEAKGMVTLAR